MSHLLETEFPRGLFNTDALLATPMVVKADGAAATDAIRVSRIALTPGSAAEVVIFQNSGGGTEYFRWAVRVTANAAGTVVLNFPKYFPEGLEVLRDGAATGVGVTISFFDDIAP